MLRGATAVADLSAGADDGFGLRRAPAALVAEEEAARRVEDWIVGTLGVDEPGAEKSLWADLVGLRTATLRAPRSRSRRDGEKAPNGWERFRVSRLRGVTVVFLTDTALTRPQDLSELDGDLRALAAAGHTRLVLNCAAVERMSSWVVGVIADLHRLCAAAPGGALKVCGLRPSLVPVFRVTGLGRDVVVTADEAAAVDGPWPEAPGLRALPVEVLAALLGKRQACGPEAGPVGGDDGGSAGGPAMTGVHLILESGRAKGRAVAVRGDRFLIGRDPTCPLRPGAATVSRFHAAIERRGGRLVVCDLGSTNGTVVNGRVLHKAAAELSDGDRVQVGPFAFTVSLGRADPDGRTFGGVEDLVAGWVQGERPADAGPATLDGLPVAAEEDDDAPGEPVRHEVIEGVVIVTPVVTELEAGPAVDALRDRLRELAEGGAPPRVVVNLTRVGQVSARAIGVMVAHHLRLDGAGGALRVCEANPRVAALLEQVRLGMLVECHATVDDAVLAAWPDGAGVGLG